MFQTSFEVAGGYRLENYRDFPKSGEKQSRLLNEDPRR